MHSVCSLVFNYIAHTAVLMMFSLAFLHKNHFFFVLYILAPPRTGRRTHTAHQSGQRRWCCGDATRVGYSRKVRGVNHSLPLHRATASHRASDTFRSHFPTVTSPCRVILYFSGRTAAPCPMSYTSYPSLKNYGRYELLSIFILTASLVVLEVNHVFCACFGVLSHGGALSHLLSCCRDVRCRAWICARRCTIRRQRKLSPHICGHTYTN